MLIKNEIILGIYVDDVLISGEDTTVNKFIEEFKIKYKSIVYESVNDFIGCGLFGMKTNQK